MIDFIDAWCDMYKPIINHFDDNASFDNGYGGIMFETYGAEEQFVREMAIANPLRVWTYVDGNGGTFIVNGMQFVNRIGYFITELPADDACSEIEVSRDSL